MTRLDFLILFKFKNVKYGFDIRHLVKYYRRVKILVCNNKKLVCLRNKRRIFCDFTAEKIIPNKLLRLKLIGLILAHIFISHLLFLYLCTNLYIFNVFYWITSLHPSSSYFANNARPRSSKGGGCFLAMKSVITHDLRWIYIELKLFY